MRLLLPLLFLAACNPPKTFPDAGTRGEVCGQTADLYCDKLAACDGGAANAQYINCETRKWNQQACCYYIEPGTPDPQGRETCSRQLKVNGWTQWCQQILETNGCEILNNDYAFNSCAQPF